MRGVLLIAVLAIASVAHANVWDHATDPDAGALDAYRDAMSQGDGYIQQASAEGITLGETKDLVEKAIDAYKLAATKRPAEGEPYFRIAETLGTFYSACSSGNLAPLTCPRTARGITPASIDAHRGRQTVSAWDEFEKRAPLDPRVADGRFERAILRTKLVEISQDAKPLLELALADYVSLLDHADGTATFELDTVWGNLAETYMMLNRLEEAVDAYRVAVSLGANASIAFGLAVALDRDGSPAEAMDVIRFQGVDAVKEYFRLMATGVIFYVPDGEEHYYKALIFEAWGYWEQSAKEWREFLDSGAQPQFRARAKQHLETANKKSKEHSNTATRDFEEFAKRANP
jgi:tetratricopeptide (TPR) repeat protein